MSKRILIPLLACLSFLVVAGPAQAQFGFKDLSVEFEDQLGQPITQAGAHPFAMTTTLNMNTVLDQNNEEVPDEAIRDLVVALAPGFVGDPKAAPTCASADFNTLLNGGYNTCPDASTIGVISVRLEPGPFVREFAVFNLDPGPGEAARIGFVGFNLPVTLGVRVAEDGSYNVISSGFNIPQSAPFYGADLTLWGDPSDPAHEPQRGGCLERGLSTQPHPREDCTVPDLDRAFLTMPRNCSQAQTTRFEARSWQTPGVWVEDSITDPPLEGCENLPEFHADIAADPDSQQASSPTALDFSISIDDPGLRDPDELPQSDIKAARVTLPKGVAINPAQAAALEACTPTEFAAEKSNTALGQGCPAGSQIGTVEVETPLLEGTVLEGNVFVAAPFDNPFNTLIALYMTIKDPQLGVNVGLAGKVEPIETGPDAGQIVTSFDNLPQLPFSEFRFHFRGGPRSALSTPERCGSYTTEAVFTPWATPDDPFTTTSSFDVTSGPDGSPCPQGPLPFDPSFAAGTTDNQAGSFSPFVVRLQKGDGQQEITRVDSILPPGVTGKLTGIPQCSDAALAAAEARSGKEELAAPSCPAASRLGSVTAGSGVGPELTYVDGSIYLAGPYEGAPLSIAVVTPAVAGPFDLGTVVIREGLDLDPTTAEVHVAGSAAEPIPTFLEGIPLRLRDLRVMIDRKNFTLNATGCEPKTVQGSVVGSESGLAARSVPYQATNCGSLAFKPKLKLALKGSTTRSGHPALRSLLTPRAGDANIGRAVVTLPPSMQIDNAHINNPCTRVQFNANQCPPASILGTARAETPLLDQPLEGPVYFRSNGGERELPDVVADLHGTFDIVLVGFVDSKKARLRTTFANVPDAPVSRFQLNLYGGKRGLLVNNRNLCAGKQRAKLNLSGQNGRIYRSNQVLKTSCKAKKSKQTR